MTGVVRRYLDQGTSGVLGDPDDATNDQDRDIQEADQAAAPTGMIQVPQDTYLQNAGTGYLNGQTPAAPPASAPAPLDPFLQNAGMGYMNGGPYQEQGPPAPPEPMDDSNPGASDTYDATQKAASSRAPDRYSILADRLEAALNKQPVMKKPNWLERIGAAGAGAAAGWTNAAGRIKHPIDIQAMQQGILHPGYNASMEAWKSEIAPLEAQFGIEGQRQAAGLKGQQVYNETMLKAAESKAAMDKGQYWLHRAQTEQMRFTRLSNGAIFDKLTGEVKSGAPTKRDLYEGLMAIPGMTAEMATYGAANGGTLSGYGSTLANPTKPPVVMTAADHLAMRANGISTGVKQFDDMSPAQAKAVLHDSQNHDADQRRQFDEGRDNRNDNERINREHTNAVRQADVLKNQKISQLLVNARAAATGYTTEAELWNDPKYKLQMQAIVRETTPLYQGAEDSYADAMAGMGHAPANRIHYNPDTGMVDKPAQQQQQQQTTTPAGGQARPAAAQGPPAPPADGPVRVNIEGTDQVFPNKAAWEAYKKAAAAQGVIYK